MAHKAHNSRKSPHSIPRTQQDVDRAAQKGRDDGIKFILTAVVWLLADKHSAPDEEITQFSQEVAYLCDSIAKGYVSYPDIVRALKKEHDWDVEVYHGEEANPAHA